MPPKRKQNDDTALEASTSTRSTRTSTRSSTAKTTTKETAAPKATNAKKTTGRGAAKSAVLNDEGDDQEDASESIESARPAKKARTSAPSRKKATNAAASRVQNDEDHARKHSFSKEEPRVEHATSNNGHKVEPPAPKTSKSSQTSKKSTKKEPYSAQGALQLFEKYADSDDTNVIGPDGFVQLCTDAGMPMEGALPIIFEWQLNAKEMAKISKEEWVAGTTTLQISSIPQISAVVKELEDLLILEKRPVSSTAKGQPEYDRKAYLGYAADVKSAFQKLYFFSFNLVKPEGSKNIEMETAIAFWTVLLVPKYPLMGEIIRFINEKGTYKASNKDLWSMMLEFCQTVSPTLENYEADGAWPTLLDDFVAWKSIQSSNGAAEPAAE